MKSFIITSATEKERAANVANLLVQLPDAELIEAIYPSKVHVPFLHRMMELSEQRTGHRLLPAEIGCLLSHRIIWRKIVAAASEAHEHFLVLESDSLISEDFFTTALLLPGGVPRRGEVVSTTPSAAHPPLLKGGDPLLSIFQTYDLFFFGAWLGHMKLFRSTRQKINDIYTIGTPFIKTVYCTYGYSLNQKAAAYLLQQTYRIGYPVDQFKYFVDTHAIRLGGIVPELISGGQMGSYINQDRFSSWRKKWVMNVLSIKNNIICFFK